jgi:hypothetical protein
MNAPDGLWRQWSAQLRAFLPEIHGHRSKTLAFVVLGVVLAGSTRLPRVAETLGGISAAKTPSIERRLARFLANQQVAVLPLWTHLLSQFLTFWRERRLVFVLVFVLDATALDDRATVLYLGLLVHSRLLPVSWQLLPVQQKWEQRQWEVVGALLDRVIPHLGAADCTLLADWPIAAWSGIRWCTCVSSAAGTTCSACLLNTPASPRVGTGHAAGSRAVTWSRSAAASGTVRSGSGRSAHWRPRSVPPGSPSERSRGSSSPTGPPDGSGCASMPAECASNRPFKI